MVSGIFSPDLLSLVEKIDMIIVRQMKQEQMEATQSPWLTAIRKLSIQDMNFFYGTGSSSDESKYADSC